MPSAREFAAVAVVLAMGGWAGWAVGMPVESASLADPWVLRPVAVPDPHPLFVEIVATNLVVAGLLAGGIFTGGLTTVATLAFNGIAWGTLLRWCAASGMSGRTVLLLVGPHGWLELIGLLLAGAVGLRGVAVAGRAFRSDRWTVGAELRRGFPALAVAAGCVAGAAAVEALVTRWLLLQLLSA